MNKPFLNKENNANIFESIKSNKINKILFWITIVIWLILAWNHKSNITNWTSNYLFWLHEANAKMLSNLDPWKKQILNNLIREWTLYNSVVWRVTDVISLDNWIFAIVEWNNIICYVLENGEMFLNLYESRTQDGIRDGSIQRVAWYREILISTTNSSKIDINKKIFGYCWHICKTPYVLCLDASKIRFSLIENLTNKEITQDNKLEYFIAQCNISRTYAMSQLSRIMSKQKWDKGFRINIPELVSATFHFKIMRPKHLKELVDKQRIDDITYKRLITKYFAKDWLFHEMLNDPFYKKISTHFWDPITSDEVNQYINYWWLDKKTWEKLKGKNKL